MFKVGVQLQRDQCQNFSLGHNFMDTPLIEAKLLKNAASKFSVNLAMSPQKVTFLKKPPFSNLSSYCSDSVSVTIKIIKQKTESDKPVGLTRLWGSVEGLLIFRNCQRQPLNESIKGQDLFLEELHFKCKPLFPVQLLSYC